ncbi:FAD binding domain-containing protein [Paramyrothecium foliicola]|nr:FAD binding domain-containing protein [Paramyrothecium foliicola]
MEMIHNIPQPEFEEFIAAELATNPNVEIKKGVAFLSCRQDDEDSDVFTTVQDRNTGASWEIRSKYVIACDGAQSQVREFLGIENEGEDGYETMMTIHFKADLNPVVKEPAGMLHWILDPACSGFIIAYDLRGNQVLISNFDSEKSPAESWTEQLAREMVVAAIGQDIPVEILSYRPWVLSRKVAKEYRRGRVFLVGDAAHSFPPASSLGLNPGLADAHNLAWKIAAAHQGWANPSILDSYCEERRQIALVNTAQSIKNEKNIFSFLKVLGTAGITDVEKAREKMFEAIHDPSKKELIARKVEAQREHFDNLEIHIGYVYGDKRPPFHASHYTPKFKMGARLPHAWIKLSPHLKDRIPPVDTSYVSEFSTKEIVARQHSILDLISPLGFTLIASSDPAWTERFKECKLALGWLDSHLQFRIVGHDFTFVSSEHQRLFEEEANLLEGGALLVRPDQHLLACPNLKSLESGVLLAQTIFNSLGFSN